ncbi:MAG: CBS domain-containing protein, partial [Bacteroidota bacterium]|nr:CBS domain-containing protein [Bacteroidota bacterium]
ERLLKTLHIDYPIHGKLILWDDIHALKNTPSPLQLTAAKTRLKTLHPSDLADIIEDLDKTTRINLFSTLDEEQAADVLEEMDTDTQVEMVESLPKEKVADVLEKMPADEAADILDELKDEKAEELLREMENESSEDIRELLEYPDKEVGSIMTRDYMTFRNDMTVEETLKSLRKEKPEPSYIYSLFVVDKDDKFLSAIPLGDIAVADPKLQLDQIMQKNPVIVYDDDDIDILADLVSKYNLLAVPVLNHDREIEGVVVIEDIVEDLLGNRKTK